MCTKCFVKLCSTNNNVRHINVYISLFYKCSVVTFPYVLSERYVDKDGKLTFK